MTQNENGGRIIVMQFQAELEQVGTGLKNAAAYNEWRRILERLPNAILTEGMEQSLRVGAVYLRNMLKAVIPRSKKLRNPDGRHLADTGVVVKGRQEWFPSWLVKFGNARARHFHLLEYGFTKRDGTKKGPTYLLANETQMEIPKIDQIVAEETRKREPQIIQEATNRYA